MSAPENPIDSIAVRRTEYAARGLAEAELAADPIDMFEHWYVDAADLPEPNAMVVATVSAAGAPSVRTVLLKGIDAKGLVFFTNLGSRKGTDLAANPHCALLFPWHPLERQVRIEGVAEQVSRDEVTAYFAKRPRGSQLGARASRQSHPVTADELASAFAREDAAHPDQVPVPDEWGGFRVRPTSWEFWQGRTNRMHDRFTYLPADGGWTIQRLAP